MEQINKYPPFLRVGWANTTGFQLFLGSGDGCCFMAVGTTSTPTASTAVGCTSLVAGQVLFRRGDVIGCALDLVAPEIRFAVATESAENMQEWLAILTE